MSNFKPGEQAKYIGRRWPKYTGTIVTVLSFLEFREAAQMGPRGTVVKMPSVFYFVRFHDGMELYCGFRIVVPPWDLERPDSEIIEKETEANKELET